jgi:hypothetical protein
MSIKRDNFKTVIITSRYDAIIIGQATAAFRAALYAMG